MRQAGILLVLAALIAPTAALAHGKPGSHGGQMLLAGSHRFELIAKETTFEIYISSLKKEPITDLSTVTGSATIHSNNDKRTDDVALAANGDHLEGKANLNALSPAEIHVKITVGGTQATMAFEYPPD
ncbi:MAG: hypothetical protein ABI609_14345 [Acidobacteriota bacterium]